MKRPRIIIMIVVVAPWPGRRGIMIGTPTVIMSMIMISSTTSTTGPTGPAVPPLRP